MDYLEEATRLLRVASEGGSEEDTGPSAEQIVATRAVASALIALVERLDATAQDVAARVELASEISGLKFPDKLAKIVLVNTELLKVLNEQLVEIDREIETVKRQQTALLDASGRIDEIEKTLSGVATWCGSIEMRIEIIEGVNSGKE